MNSNKMSTRVAGALYVLGGVPVVYSLQYVPKTLIVPGDGTATPQRHPGFRTEGEEA